MVYGLNIIMGPCGDWDIFVCAMSHVKLTFSFAMDAVLKKERIKAQDRENHRRFRMRQKKRQWKLIERLEALQEMTSRSAMYLEILAERTVHSSSRSRELRYLILDLLMDYFQFGADPSDAVEYEKQEAFLSFNCTSNFYIDTSNAHIGHKAFLQQWVMYSQFHQPFKARKQSLFSADQGEIYTLEFVADLTITYQTIEKVYPHMLSNAFFLQKVVGKVIQLPVIFHVIYNSSSKITSIVADQRLAQAWYTLLRDPTLISQVLGQAEMEKSIYIKPNSSPV